MPLARAGLGVTLAVLFVAATEGGEPPSVRLERVDGTTTSGGLLAIDGDAVRIATADGEAAVPLAVIRRLVRETTGGPPAGVLVSLSNGGLLSGGDVRQEGPLVVVTRDAERIEVPLERVRRLAWLPAGETEPTWLAGLPQPQATDLVVVRRNEGHAFVECAIAGLSAESVTVVLDGETIPVKRAKVLGLAWLREDRPPGATVVEVAGGRLTAGRVAWSPAGLVLDDEIRLPAAALQTIDYAAGRTTPLAAAAVEKTSGEPFFAALADLPALASFFAPRTLADPEGAAGALIVRPRTTITWRVPTEARRFHGSLRRDVPAQATAAVDVSLAVDGAERFRRRLGGGAGDSGEPVAIDLDVTAGRRLTLTLDFVAGDPGCRVRLEGGAFEK